MQSIINIIFLLFWRKIGGKQEKNGKILIMVAKGDKGAIFFRDLGTSLISGETKYEVSFQSVVLITVIQRKNVGRKVKNKQRSGSAVWAAFKLFYRQMKHEVHLNIEQKIKAWGSAFILLYLTEGVLASWFEQHWRYRCKFKFLINKILKFSLIFLAKDYSVVSGKKLITQLQGKKKVVNGVNFCKVYQKSSPRISRLLNVMSPWHQRNAVARQRQLFQTCVSWTSCTSRMTALESTGQIYIIS